MGLAGLLLTAIGAALAAVGYYYFDFSLWLMIPGGLLALVGMSLLSGAEEQVLSSFRHRIADSHDKTGRNRNDPGDSGKR